MATYGLDSGNTLAFARRTLPQKLVDRVTQRPTERIAAEQWAQLSPQQRAAVLQLRQLVADGFDTPTPRPAPRAAPAAALVRADPLTTVTENDPTTGLAAGAMNELFGGTVDTTGLQELEGHELMSELRRRFYAKHVTLDYETARRRMFTMVDNEGGEVRDVYTGRSLNDVRNIPSADGAESFNTEHTWPQSQLKRAGKVAAVSDLHHLFPVDTDANGKRGSYPFGKVSQVQWQRNGSKLGLDAKGNTVFEPPAGHRGDVARALFWISTAYEMPLPDGEEAVLKEWAAEDPVDAAERTRNARIAKVQGDYNPFVLEPVLAAQVSNF